MNESARSASAASLSGMRWLDRTATKLTLRPRILLLLCLAALPGMAVAVYLAVTSLAEQTRQIETNVARLAKLGAAQHETVISNARMLLEAVSRSQTLTDVDRAECRSFLTGWVDKFAAFTSLTLFDANGEVACSNLDSELPFGASSQGWFEAVQEQRDFVLGSYTIGRTGQPLLIAGFPMLSGDDRPIGAVALGIDLRWLNFIIRTIELPEGSSITAVNKEGQILSHHDARAAEEKAESTTAPPSPLALKQMAILSGGTLRAEDANGSPRLYGFQKTDSGDVVVAVGMPPYLRSAEYGEALFKTLGPPLLILLLALTAAAWASEAFVTRYVRSLTQTAETIAEGDLSARSEIPYAEDEIGRLAAAFDDMAQTIETNQAELRELVDERETLIRELNHRVKNNLQIVLSLLHMEGREITGQTAQERLRSLGGRVKTLAEIHRLLYQTHDAHAPLGDYVEQLAGLFSDFYDLSVGPVEIDETLRAVKLRLGQSISVGLILNELVSNAHKHAFGGGRPGRVRLRVFEDKVDARSQIHLVVEDDGVGLPPSFDFTAAKSTGSRIVAALVRQLGGTIWTERRTPGLAVHVRFPPQTSPQRPSDKALQAAG